MIDQLNDERLFYNAEDNTTIIQLISDLFNKLTHAAINLKELYEKIQVFQIEEMADAQKPSQIA